MTQKKVSYSLVRFYKRGRKIYSKGLVPKYTNKKATELMILRVAGTYLSDDWIEQTIALLRYGDV